MQGRSCYWIDVARIRTAKQDIEWTSHLMAKDWLPSTDWDELLGQVEGQLPD